LVRSLAAVEPLGPVELGAVLAHEQAHLDQRHDLLRELFTVLHNAVPRRIRADESIREVHLPGEMLPDRAAARRVRPVVLARALVAMAGAGPADAGGTAHPGPPGGTVTGGTQVAVRLRAFAADPARPALRGAVVAAGAFLLILPVLVMQPLLWNA